MRGFLVLALAMAGCVPRAVNERIGALEARVAGLEAAGSGANLAPPRADDTLVRTQFMEAEAEVARGDTAAARDTLQGILDANPDPRAESRIRQYLSDLSIVGQPAGSLADSTVAWVQGESEWSEGRHLVVFFETWCPHCRRELPLVDDRLAGRDASAVLLTRLSRDASVESVQEFLTANDVQEPVAYVRQDVADRFGITGIPAAAVVEDGVIIWRGHPATLEGDLLDRVLPAL
ncbi:MAG: thiol-disulfide isomerase/thioredoxin [Myxococcota bacterium]|jgi:thiol-disulfide isomerase/thioredoxin